MKRKKEYEMPKCCKEALSMGLNCCPKCKQLFMTEGKDGNVI